MHRTASLFLFGVAWIVCLGAGGRAAPLPPNESATWELSVLGVNDPARLEALRDAPKRRRVKLAVVGEGGVSAKCLEKFVARGDTFTYHGCGDPGASTHDTGQLAVTLDMTAALGVDVDVHVWQPPDDFTEVAAAFREAGKTCAIVSFYQSFWGPNAEQITRAIRESPAALFISPYAESGDRPTSEAPQGSALKPWVADSIPHFILATPLARRESKGDLLTPLDRGASDSEIINFVAPSHHANGPGGTCPAAATTSACAAYLYAILPGEPRPADIIELLRVTSAIDPALIKSVPEFDDAAVERLRQKIEFLLHPPAGKQRKLDAPGVLNLYQASLRVLHPAGQGAN